jgi:hypothetical protein
MATAGRRRDPILVGGNARALRKKNKSLGGFPRRGFAFLL